MHQPCPKKDTSRGNPIYPVEAAQELAFALAGDGDGRGILLELAGVGLPMGAALAVLVPLAPVLLHHVELGHGWRRRMGSRAPGAAKREESQANPTAQAFNPSRMPGDSRRPFLCCLEIRARSTWRLVGFFFDLSAAHEAKLIRFQCFFGLKS